jgi:YgiT-type zinc finger domain-containing protein
MDHRCPLCKAGRLEPTVRDLAYEGRTLRTPAWSCPACREVLLDGPQTEALRAAIRREGLAETDEQVEAVLEQLALEDSR